MKRFDCLIIAAVSIACVSTASAVLVDGVFTPSDAYSNVQSINFQLDNGHMVPDPGTLAWSTDAQGNVYVAFVQPLSINDNTYGANSIGWVDKHGHPSEHRFDNLVGSDRGHFDFFNGAGQLALSFDLDYITRGQNNTYISMGVTGGDGRVQHGSSSNVLQWGTSLGFNLNTLGHSSFTTDSPATMPHLNPDGTIDYSQPYFDPLSAPGWVYYIEYEVQVSAAAFGASGFGHVVVPYAHDSPSKFGQNTIVVVPEASTYIAGLFALLIAFVSRIKWPSKRRAVA